MDRGNGVFAYLAIDTVPDYLDTAALPAAAPSAVWKNKAIYRYDGKSLELFCDGHRMAGKLWSGKRLTKDAHLLIGAEAGSGKIGRHFQGEREEAALWSRALGDDELTNLSR